MSHEDVRFYPREGVLLMPRLKEPGAQLPFFSVPCLIGLKDAVCVVVVDFCGALLVFFSRPSLVVCLFHDTIAAEEWCAFPPCSCFLLRSARCVSGGKREKAADTRAFLIRFSRLRSPSPVLPALPARPPHRTPTCRRWRT